MFPFSSHRTPHSHDRSSSEALLNTSEKLDEPPIHRVRRTWPRLTLALLLVLSHLLIAVFAAWAAGRWRLDIDGLCARHTTQFSPVLRDVKIKYSTVSYNGSFFHPTIYRQDPSPEVDEAWKALGVDYRSVGIPRSEAAAAGLAPDQVKIREKYGGYYPANVEGLHHLHCLNLLRQSLKFNYDYYKAQGHGAFKNEEPIVKVHVTHCLDTLRQQLMCIVDTGLLGQVWWNPAAPTPFVDFNTRHTCKNYDAVRKWAEKRQLPEDTPVDYLEPPRRGDRVYAEIP